jgi:ABC-type multidrug transport system ATPase subunit
VPQGRRVWPSLSVDETLRRGRTKKRDVDRVYTMFPRLAERKGNGGAQLSGGEQQMLAIGRALLLQPRLLVMDEPTEGLAPVIVEQVEQALRDLAAEGEIAVLLIEQNLGVALDVADRIGVMVNGRIAHRCRPRSWRPTVNCRSGCSACARRPRRRSGSDEPRPPQPRCRARRLQVLHRAPRARRWRTRRWTTVAPRTVRGFNRWNAGGTAGR